MLGATLSFSVMGGLAKFLSGEQSAVQLAFWRGLSIWAVAHVLLRRQGLAIRPGDLRRMALRCGFGLVALLCFFWSIGHLPLATATTLQYTSPLFTALLAAPILGERLTVRAWGWVWLAFGGILLILRPSFAVGAGPLLVGLAGGLCAALAYIFVRSLRKTDAPARIVWWFAAATTVLTAPFALAQGWPGSVEALLVVLSLGLASAGGQYGMTVAYKLERATVIAPLSYATVVFSALLGALFFKESLGPLSLVGMALFLLAGVRLSARRAQA